MTKIRTILSKPETYSEILKIYIRVVHLQSLYFSGSGTFLEAIYWTLLEIMAENFIYQLQLLREQELHEMKTVWLVAIQENQIHILAANRNLQIVRQQIKQVTHQLDCITDTGYNIPSPCPHTTTA